MARPFLALRGAVWVGAVVGVACVDAGHDGAGPHAPAPSPAAYAVRLNRAHRPGERGMVSTVVRSRRATVLEEGDRIVKREAEDREVDLEAMVDVIRVDAAGAPVTLAYTIEHLRVQTPEGRTEVLPGGWVVGAEPGGGRVAFRSAQPLPDEARRALDEVLSPLSSESTDDDIFGTAEPQTVGASWPVNAALTARELAHLHLDVPAEAVHGKSQLVGLVEVAGQVCLDVAGDLSISDPRMIDVPGAHTDAAELRSSYRALMPADTTSPGIDATLRVDLDVTARVALGPDREERMRSTSHRERRRRFVPLR